MSVLFIGSAEPDYQNDVLLHGLRSLLKTDLIDLPQKSCMYKGLHDERPIYGRGFTIFKTLDNTNVDRSDIVQKIKDKFFDFIIYGSCRRNLSFLDVAVKTYGKEKIIFVDGEDDSDITWQLLSFGKYFKREIYSETESVHSISFGFPKEKIAIEPVQKTKDISFIIPNFNQGYSFEKESEYYSEYQSSKFAWTWKKAGWDCLRHYEILFNKCLPIFYNLENLPNLTMKEFPKERILEYQTKWFSKLDGVNENSMILDKFDNKEYEDIVNEIFEYACSNLTTEQVANRVISSVC